MDALQLIERCVAAHAERAWRLAFALMGNAADADDVLQQSLIIAWRKARRAPAEPWPWLAGIITLEARNARRKRAYRSHAPLKEALSMTDYDPALAELHAAIRKALQELPEPQREAVALTHISGFTQEEAARLLNLPLNTLKARVRRGLDALRERIRHRDPDIAQRLLTLPLAPPIGGIAAARAEWIAVVHHHAGAGVTAGAGQVKLMAAGVASLLLAAALVLWFSLDNTRPSLQAPEFTANDLPERRADKPRSRDLREAEPRTAPPPEAVDEKHELPDTQPRPQAPPIDLPHREKPRPPAPAAPAEAEEETEPSEPVPQSGGTTVERLPVLWLADWPAEVAARRVGSNSAYAALRRAESEFDNERATDDERLVALLALPNGHAFCVPQIWVALGHPWWQIRDTAMRWIEREQDAKALEALGKLLWETETTDSRRVQLMVALLRNAEWATEANWKLAAERFITGPKAFDATLAPVLVQEMAHVRGDMNDRRVAIEHRNRAALLMDINNWIPRSDSSSFTDVVRVAVECLTSHGFAEPRQQETLRRSLRSGHGVIQPLMRERRTFEAGNRNWRVTTIDRDHERGTKYALLILAGPQWSEEIYLPWVIGLEQEFKCYIVEYLDWQRDLEEDESTDAISRGYVSRMASRIEALRAYLELGAFGLIADDWMAGVAAEYCRTHERGDFLMADLWPSAAMFAGHLSGRSAAAKGPGRAYLEAMSKLVSAASDRYVSSATLQEGEVAALGVGGWRAVRFGRLLRAYDTRTLAALQDVDMQQPGEHEFAPLLTNVAALMRRENGRHVPRWMQQAIADQRQATVDSGPAWLRDSAAVRVELIRHLQTHRLIDRRR